MNKDNAKDYLPLVQALAEGKTIEFQDCQGFWCGNPQVNFDAPASSYRIKPSPSYRPWTFEEVPIGAVVVRKDGERKAIITGVVQRHSPNICISDSCQPAFRLLDDFTLLDGQPCGVAV